MHCTHLLSHKFNDTTPSSCKWQRGECLPTFDNMYAMSCYFDVTIDEILVGNRQEFFYFIESSVTLFYKVKSYKICRIIIHRTDKISCFA